jgi:hypothetical protein
MDAAPYKLCLKIRSVSFSNQSGVRPSDLLVALVKEVNVEIYQNAGWFLPPKYRQYPATVAKP